MKILVVTPIAQEIDCFLQSCAKQGIEAETMMVGRLPVTRFGELDMGVAQGGLGKAQFAVQTQYLLDRCPEARLVICAGAAGALSANVAVGDVVVATETIEHDIQNRFGPPLLPKFPGAAGVLATLGELPQATLGFQVHFAPVASGDEDVVDHARREAIQTLTGALAVAWEGAGGARACQFSGVDFVEIRGVTDSADSTAPADFEKNLGQALGNVAKLITLWAKHQT
jgi:adenosylhomocysteine nucleosidase